jgi:hypothetical protein
MSAAAQQAMMFAALFRSTGATVAYSRGGSTYGFAPAVRGRSSFEGNDGHGARLQIETEDFIFLESSLQAINLPLPPSEGDLITLANSRAYILTNPPYHEETMAVMLRCHGKRWDQ